jgi:serine/threonine protein kinase
MQKPCNYYDKYIKYKKKYIDYKNKLLDMKGGGINSNILFYTVRDGSSENVSSTELTTFFNDNNISKLHIKILYEKNTKFIAYRFIDKVGSGSYSNVYQIEQVEPVPEPGSQNFVIKLNTDGKEENMDEGLTIDMLNVSSSVKAIFQGEAEDNENIFYAIYNYLGQNLRIFFGNPANLVGLTDKQYMSLIEQLHIQLYAINSKNQFHNDVKIENIVMRKMTGSDEYELSLIDYGILTFTKSNRGTFQSMYIRGCAQYLSELNPQVFYKVKPLLVSTSTDYVGFFHVVIFLLNPKINNTFEIYKEILQLIPENEKWYTSSNLCKVLCLLCYVSVCSDKTDVDIVDAFLSGNSDTVAEIDKVLNIVCTCNNLQKFTTVISGYGKDMNIYTERRLLFLCFIYSKIIVDYGKGYDEITPIEELPLFLWNFSCCFNFRFDLEEFNKFMIIKQ